MYVVFVPSLCRRMSSHSFLLRLTALEVNLELIQKDFDKRITKVCRELQQVAQTVITDIKSMDASLEETVDGHTVSCGELFAATARNMEVIYNDLV